MIRITIFLLSGTLIFIGCKKEEQGFTNKADNSNVSAQLNDEDWFGSGQGSLAFNRRDSFNAGFFVTENGFLRASLNLSMIPMREGKHIILDMMERALRDSLRPCHAGYTSFLSDGDVIGEWWDSTADSLFNYCIVDRMDTINNIIEGRFQVELVKEPTRDFFDTPDTLRFKNGKFFFKLKE